MTSTRRSPAQPLPTRRQCLRAASLAALGLGLGHLGAQAEELSDLAKVRASGILKVAIYKDNAPYSDGSTQEMGGVDVALAQALASGMGLKLSLLPFDAGERMEDDLRNMVWKGHYLGYGPADVMLHVPVDKFLIQENRQALIFAPYSREVLVVFHSRTRVPHVQSGDDLVGQTLAAERGSGAASSLMGYGGGKLRSQVRIFNSGLQAAEAVVRGEVAAAYVSRAQAEAALHAAKKSGSDFGLTQLGLPGLTDNGWAIGMAVKSGNKALALALEETLNQVRGSGQLAALYRERGLTLVTP
jgi:ABC-type amino acid transport substrate-binding protein